jgi:hypothetical protein
MSEWAVWRGGILSRMNPNSRSYREFFISVFAITFLNNTECWNAAFRMALVASIVSGEGIRSSPRMAGICAMILSCKRPSRMPFCHTAGKQMECVSLLK